ncbi:MAG: von Willebrand factor type A domain-containing protein, partial [Bacteroidales bacterium]|nr:von Willebrand factor type A domain-containing protein [Bacteroidales bacterium]
YVMNNLILILGIFLSSFAVMTPEKGIVTGTITDSQTGNPVTNATILLQQKGLSVATGLSGSDGSFSIETDAGTYDLKISATGYQPFVKRHVTLIAKKKKLVNVSLHPQKVLADKLVEKEEYLVSFYKKDRSGRPAGGVMNYTGSVDDFAYVQYNTESYDVINENNFKDVVNDPLSTFSIDVDRASYSNVRRFLNQNQKPVKDAVRIEELINYFDYSYEQPTDGHPFSSTVELDKCPWNANHKLMLIGLKGENVNEDEIPASNLVFLIDVSGSMSSANKLPLLKQAFKYLVSNLRARDKVSIVVYAGAAGLVLPPTAGNEKAKINASLDLLQSGGSTAGGAGIELAYKTAKQNFIKGGNNRVILATDGDFNIGASSDAEMVRLIESKRDDGIFLSILGFGMGNYKDSKMESISNAGNGNYDYIDNILEAKKVFGKELWGTLYTIAKDVKIQVEFNPAQVKSYRLIGYENRILNKEDFNDDKKDAGEIGCGHTVTALYELVMADSDEENNSVDPLEYQKTAVVKSKNIMTLKIRYKKPNEDVSQLIQKRYKATDLKATDNIRFAASVAEFGMLLRDSEHKANANFSQVLTMAKNSKGTDSYGYRSDFIKLIEIAEMLNK